MTKIKFEIEMEVDDSFALNEAKKWEHHADYILDLESYPEIKSISNCKVEILNQIKVKN